MNFFKKVFSYLYWRIWQSFVRVSGLYLLLAWTDPLHIARRLLRRAVKEKAIYAKGRLLDIGCGGQPYREFFNHVDNYIGLDLPPSIHVDIYGDGMFLPFQEKVIDTVLCNEVLEHIPEPLKFMSELNRVLKPQGILILTTPQTWGLHLEPHDYYRYTKYGLRYLAEQSGFEVMEITPTCGFWATAAQRFTDTVVNIYIAKSSRWLINVLSFILAPILIIGYGLDKLFGKKGDTLDYVLFARRKNG